jgi:deazaflavin-dependent oxidoreductase (nitroreductase family)
MLGRQREEVSNMSATNNVTTPPAHPSKRRPPADGSTSAATPRPKKTWLQRALRRIGNPLRMWPLLVGLPSPPYTRRNAIIVETIGRRSGKRYRIPVGFLEENGRLIVVAEDGLHSSWVRNAAARDGHLRVFLHGRWRDARLEPRAGDPEPYLRRMNKVHAAFVRTESSDPALIEITPD